MARMCDMWVDVLSIATMNKTPFRNARKHENILSKKTGFVNNIMPTHPYIVADLICGMGMKFILIVGVGLFSRHSLNMLYKEVYFQPQILNCTVGRVSTSVRAVSSVCQACAANASAPADNRHVTACTCNTRYSGSNGGNCTQC
jgi:hypothetical protein